MTFTPIIVGTGLVGYQNLVDSRELQEARLSETSVVQRTTDNFAEKLPNIQSAADLVKDHDVLTVVLGAFGLHDHIANRGLVQRILESDLTDEESLAHTYEGGRFLSLAETFNFQGEDGPNLDAVNPTPEAVAKLKDYNSASDLLVSPSFEERKILKAALKHFDLEQYSGNAFFLRQVLESDPSDPTSFVNLHSDKNLIKLAEAFNFKEKQAELSKDEGTIYAYVEMFQDRYTPVNTADDLLNDPDLLEETLNLFGLENAQYDIGYLRDVLNSDLSDPNSVANLEVDERYAALADAFEFPERAARAAEIAATPDGEEPPATFRGNLEKMIEAVEELDGKIESADEYFENLGIYLAAGNFFGIKAPSGNSSQRDFELGYLKRVLSSDLTDPSSTANRAYDKRFLNLATAFKIPQPVDPTVVTYPTGFADAIIDRYHSEEFLVAVGETDPTMRYALSFGKGLQEVLEDGSNESQWISVIASVPLSEVFRTIFNLPASFAGLDLDQQVNEFRSRAQRTYGTDELSDFGSAPLLDEVRERYLNLAGSLNNSGIGASNNALLSLFSG